MMKQPQVVEAFALRLSMLGYVFMAALGITFAVLTQSEAIMLDGVYSLISFIMAILAGRVAKLVELPGSDMFHFGYAHFEPWLNAIRGLLILLLCSFAFFSAVSALLHEGRPLSPGLGVVYGVGAAAGCILLAILQRRHAEQAGSPLLQVDSRNWFVDGVVSSGVALTFIVATLSQRSNFAHLVPYVDPVLVLTMTVFLIRIPIMSVWENLKEILQVAPEPAVQEDIRGRVKAAVADLPMKDVQIRMV